MRAEGLLTCTVCRNPLCAPKLTHKNPDQALPTEMFNLLKPTGYGMQHKVEYFNNCTLYPHFIYVFCICLRNK
jgi:hypothetical protein